MEKKIINILDNLNLSEIDLLTDFDMKFRINPRSSHRIKSKIFKKTGAKNKRVIPRNFISFAATFAFAIVLITILSINFNSVKAIINDLFSFISNYQIAQQDNNKDIKYVIEKTELSENDNVKIYLLNAYASNRYINITLKIERKSNVVEKNSDIISAKDIILYSKANKYFSSNFSIGDGDKESIIYANFALPSADIGTDFIYKLNCSNIDLPLKFTLKAVESFASLDDIGPTVTNNNISITAISKIKNSMMDAFLYPVNNSEYKTVSFPVKSGMEYFTKKVVLLTDKGTETYLPIKEIQDSTMAMSYRFDISDDSKDYTLKIPYIIVTSNEQKDITLPLPVDDESLQINKYVSFKDSIMKIISIQKVFKDGGKNLKINVEYDNKSDSKIMSGVSFNRIDDIGNMTSGSFSSITNNNIITKTIYCILNSDENDELKLRLSEPKYILTDEYNIKLNNN